MRSNHMWMKSSQMWMRSNRMFKRTTDFFPCFLLVSSTVWDIFSGIAPCFLLAAQILHQCRRKLQKQRQPLLVQNSSKPIYFYQFMIILPLWLAGMTSNKQLTLLSLCKLKHVNGSANSVGLLNLEGIRNIRNKKEPGVTIIQAQSSSWDSP